MKHLVIGMLCFAAISCQSQWASVYEDGQIDLEAHEAVAFWGGFVVVGTKDVEQPDSLTDGWLAQLDDDGEVTATFSYGYPDATDQIESVVSEGLLSSAVVTAGSSDGPGSHGGADGWLLRIDDAGEVVAETYFGGQGDDSFSDVVKTSDGGYVAVGSTTSFGPGASDVYAMKVDNDFDVKWEKWFGGIENDRAKHVEEIVLPSDPDGRGYLISGETQSYGQGNNDWWILILDSGGNLVMQRTYGSPGSDRDTVACQVLDTAGNPDGYVLAGVASIQSVDAGFADIAAAIKIDNNGDIVWKYSYGPTYAEGEVHSIAPAVGGGHVLGGWTGGADQDGWLLAINEDGTVKWSRRYGSWQGYSHFLINSVNRSLLQTGYIFAGYTNSFGAEGLRMPFVLSLDANGLIPGCSLIRHRPAEPATVDLVPEEEEIQEGSPDTIPNIFKHVPESLGFKKLQVCPLGCLFYVDQASPSPYDGTSWPTAFTEINEGIAAATAELPSSPVGYCEVWTAQGTYYTYETSETDTVAMADDINVYGGLSNTTDYFEQDFELNETIISGEQEGTPENRVYHVVTGANSLLDGFTITRGFAIGATLPEQVGGGFASLGKKTAIRNCTFSDNFAALSGGAVHVQGGEPFIESCSFNGNGFFENPLTLETYQTANGGGVSSVAAPLILRDCLFDANKASYFGGGLYTRIIDSSVLPPLILQTEFSDNEAQAGAAIFNFNEPATSSTPYIATYMFNLLIHGNTSTGFDLGGEIVDGAVLNAGANAHPSMIHCTMADNFGAARTGGLYSYESDSLVYNSIFWQNHGGLEAEFISDPTSNPEFPYSDIQDIPNVPWEDPPYNNKDVDPVFDTFAYTLQAFSQCIDTGEDMTALYPWMAEFVSIDISGNFRPVGDGYDMGAYERQ